MSEDQDKQRGSLALWLIVAALPIAYLLSIGPAFWLSKHGYLSKWVLYVYSPLYYVYRECEPFRVALDWYASLWGLQLSEPMTDDQHKPRNSLAAWLGIAGILLPILYVLSLGPFIWLANHGYVDRSVGVIYIPVGILRMHCPPFKVALDRYTDLWERQRMTDDQTKPLSSLTVWLILAAMLSPFAYVLSVGPAIWMFKHGYLPEWVGVLYLPLEFANNTLPPVKAFFDWYLALWGKQ